MVIQNGHTMFLFPGYYKFYYYKKKVEENCIFRSSEKAINMNEVIFLRSKITYACRCLTQCSSPVKLNEVNNIFPSSWLHKSTKNALLFSSCCFDEDSSFHASVFETIPILPIMNLSHLLIHSSTI